MVDDLIEGRVVDRSRILDFFGTPDSRISSGGREVDFYFSSDALPRESEEFNSLKEVAANLYLDAYDYLFDLLGNDAPFSRISAIGLENRERFAHQGANSLVPIGQLRKYQDVLDKPYRTVVESSAIHELVHEFRDEEDFSMMAEMIYILEKGNIGRIQEIKKLFTDNKLTQAYENGLSTISEWLGHDSVVEMLDNLPSHDLDQLKSKFKDKFRDHMDKSLKNP